MPKARYYNLLLVPDGVETPVGFRMRAWLFKTLIVMLVLIGVAIILFFSFYGKIISRAVLADQLEEENEELRKYKVKVDLLEQRMQEARTIVEKISHLAGVDLEIPQLPPDSVIFAEMENPQPAIMTRSVSALPTVPSGLPLKGYMTRGYIDDDEAFHPGIDIAAAEGSPVLATASGKVTFADYDSTYGLTVILEHENGVSTVYGHNSELLIEVGNEVLVGGRIALSGNTGVSTAPHLHYEIRENGKPVNPLKYISHYDEESD
jgi:murein DD-endopeptidase MepM/ murein hydrolase activator NlpD